MGLRAMSKYTDMMDEAAFECLDEAHINEREGNDKVAELERSKSADWRAMREAWEAMVESLDEVMQFIPYEKPELGPLPNWICKIKARAEAALAKAR